jgi:hypothetical protein
LFLGAVHYGRDAQRRKQCLVMDSDRTRYGDFISDLSGQDIKALGNAPPQAITAVRDFLACPEGRPSRRSMPTSPRPFPKSCGKPRSGMTK